MSLHSQIQIVYNITKVVIPTNYYWRYFEMIQLDIYIHLSSLLIGTVLLLLVDEQECCYQGINPIDFVILFTSNSSN